MQGCASQPRQPSHMQVDTSPCAVLKRLPLQGNCTDVPLNQTLAVPRTTRAQCVVRAYEWEIEGAQSELWVADLYFLVVGAKRNTDTRVVGPQTDPSTWWITNAVFLGAGGAVPARRMEIQEGRRVYCRGTRRFASVAFQAAHRPARAQADPRCASSR